MCVVAVRKLKDSMAIPYSVANMIHLYLFTTSNVKDVVEALDRELVFFFLKYMLEKHFGRLYLLRGELELDHEAVALKISEVVTEKGRYAVNGRAVLDIPHSSLVVSAEVISLEPVAVSVKKVLDYGIVSVGGKEVAIKYYA